ncbi:MAG: hypothetical protein Q9183_003890 [Haloplaca sp. 2 TL-2023]
MHLLSLTTLALASCFTTPLFAAPARENSLIERAGPSDAPAALAIIQQLYADIQQHTATINSTVAALSKRDNKADSKKTLKTSIASINKLVVQTTSDIKTLRKKRDVGSPAATLVERQLPPPPPPADVAAALAAALMLLLTEIGGALNKIVAALGLGEFSGVNSKLLLPTTIKLLRLPSWARLSPI